MPHSISHSNTKQRLSDNMQHAAGEQITNAILQVVLNNPDGSTILSNLAATLSDLFVADSCIVVTAEINSLGNNEVAVWQFGAILTELDIERLSELSTDTIDTVQQSAVIEATSPLFKQIDPLMQSILPSKTWLGISTQFQGRTNGLVMLLKPQSTAWTKLDRELLAENANSIAIAISQAQLQQQSQIKSRYQNLLKNLSQQISQTYQPRLLLKNCLAEIGNALELDRGMILMFKYQNPLRAKDRDRDLVKGTAKITCQWSSDSADSDSDIVSFNLARSALCQQAWQKAPECLHFSSQTAFPDLTVDSVETKGEGLLMMPLMGTKTSATDSPIVLGFLVLQTEAIHRWLQDELELVNLAGVQISTAITYDRTLNRIHLLVDERTAQLKSSMDMQGKLSAKMRQHIEQLQKLNQLKDDFMNSMSHELKTPLTSMKLAIKMLRQPELPPAMREKYLNILEQEWHREYNLIKDLLKLQQVESGELDYSPQELNLSETIADLSQSWQEKWQSQRDLNLVCNIVPAELKIHTDAESLKHIIQELLSNAAKYCDPHTTVELSASSQLINKQEQIVISVSNTGAGITPEELPHIFDKFRRGQGVTDRAVPGTGLGLALVQYLVEHINGTIEVKSEPVQATTYVTTFSLKLPQIQPAIG